MTQRSPVCGPFAPLSGPRDDLRLARGLPSRPSTTPRISASLEAIPRRKGQTALPLTRPSYEGIKGQPLLHGSQDRRRRAAIPTVDVTGVSSADFSHRSAISDAVAVLWDLRRGIRQARHCSRYYSADTDQPDPPPAGEGVRRRHVSFREGRSARTNGVPRTSPFKESGTSACPPDLLVCTPALRPGGPGPPRVPLPLPLVHAGP